MQEVNTKTPSKSFANYDEFFAFYVKEHSNPTNRLLHACGTTLGMLIADVPAVLLGSRAMKFPFKAVRYVSAAIFAAIGIAVLAGFSI